MLLLFLATLLAGCGRNCTDTNKPPLTPEATLANFQIETGFKIELLAAEPLVMDPVAMDVDELGRIFVVEMPGYPLKTDPFWLDTNALKHSKMWVLARRRQKFLGPKRV